MDALTKEYNELSEEKKRICDTIKKGMSQREAAAELGISRSTYRGPSKNIGGKELLSDHNKIT